jgi:hypothetical protein
MKVNLSTAIGLVVVPTFILIAIGIAQTQPGPIEPLPQRWRTYIIDTDMHVYEWRDDWGRVCTWTKLNGGRDHALDCDWPQLNTPRDIEYATPEDESIPADAGPIRRR